MAGKIYVLFSCDEWKSTDSMQMICATTDPNRMADVIEAELAADNMSFFWGNSSEDDFVEAFRRFKAENGDLGDVNSPLEYGHLEIVEDGEVL